MIPPEVHPADAGPVPREVTLLVGEHFLGHGEDAARAQRRYALRPRLSLMHRVRGPDPRLVRLGKVRGVVNRRANHGAVRMRCTATRKEALDDSAHPEQRSKAYEDDSSGLIGSR